VPCSRFTLITPPPPRSTLFPYTTLHLAKLEIRARRLLHRAHAGRSTRVPAAEPVREHAGHPTRLSAARRLSRVPGASDSRGDARRELWHLQRVRAVRVARAQAGVGGIRRL